MLQVLELCTDVQGALSMLVIIVNFPAADLQGSGPDRSLGLL